MTLAAAGTAADAGDDRLALVADLWAEVLGLDHVDPDDDFFALGGHSLLAFQAITRLQEALDRQLDVALVFEHPTVRQFVAQLADDDAQPARAAVLVRVDRDGDLPLSYSQARLWIGQDQIGETPFYNVPCSYRLKGALDPRALRRALDEIVARHEALRTTFPAPDARPRQVIAPPAPVPLVAVDLRGASDPLAAAREWVATEARRPFDVHTGPLLRAALLTLAPDDHVLALYMHHIVSDGSSMRVFGDELAVLYGAFSQGRSSPLAPLPAQYVDFAAWQVRALTDEVLAPHLAYWCGQLEGATVLELPVDRPRVLKRPYASGQLRFKIPAGTVSGLREAARNESATLFMVLLSGFQAMLARATGQTDICVGSPVANRNLAGAEKLIGFFVNTLVMRTDCSGNPTFGELLRRVRRVAIDAYAHQDLPFDLLVDELRPRTPPGFNPLYQVHFQVVPMPLRDIRIGDLDAEFFESSSGATPLDLFVHCFETSAGVEGWIEFSADLFDRSTIDGLLEQYLRLLEAFAVDAGQRVLDVPLGAPAAPLPGGPAPTGVARLERLLGSRATSDPDVWAVTAGDVHLTYAGLESFANRLARRLRACGVRDGDRVGILASPSAEHVAGLLGILTAGAAAVVVDAEHPPSWRNAFLTDAHVSLLVASAHLAHLGTDAHTTIVLGELADPEEAGLAPLVDQSVRRALDDLALIIPELDETGRPVARLLDHASLATRALALQEAFPLEPRDRVLQQCAPTSYLMVSELLWPLVAGAHVIMAPADIADEELAVLLRDQAITCAHVTPGQLAALLRTATLRRCPRLRRVFCSGDGASSDLAEAFAAQSGAALHFAWGSLDTAGLVLFSDGGPERPPLYRRCPGGATARVLDPQSRPVTVGSVGEIAVATATRVQRTGELARALPGGAQGLRRVDDYIDTHGHRFPLSGVAEVVRRHADVADAGVVWREDAPGHYRLVAYIEPQPPGELTDDFGLAVARVAAWQAEFDADPHRPTDGETARLESLAAFVLARDPEAVLELGCGTGWLARRIAPTTREYVAADFSERSLDAARATLAAEGIEHVAFHHREADDFLAIPSESFDTVIASSVSEYFPDVSYLTRVVEGAVAATRDGGVVVFAAVRSLPLGSAWLAWRAVTQRSSRATPASVRRELASAWKRDRELFVDPSFFSSIAATQPRLRHVEVRPCVDGDDPFCYDVVLHVGDGPAPIEIAEWIDWQDVGGVDGLGARLAASAPAELGILGVPHGRVAGHAAAARELQASPADDDEALNTGRNFAPTEVSVDPARITALAHAIGYDVDTSWATARPDGAFDVALRRPSAAARPVAFPVRTPADRFTNDPLAWAAVSGRRGELAADVTAFVRTRLPAAMTPVATLIVDEIPRNADGRPDTAALPVPEGARPALPTVFRAPGTPTEEAVGPVVAEVLGLEIVGVDDDFFVLGGHSLLALQVTARLQQVFAVELDPGLLFDAPTVARLAAVIDEGLAAASSAAAS